MGIIQRDQEERTSNKADEVAEQKYGRTFSNLPASLQMQVWMDAEQEARGTTEAVQASLRGVWLEAVRGCPHLHRRRDDIDRCDAREMTICVYENGKAPCEILQEIIEEWRIELEICPECCQVRPDDDRVKAGMKCGFCARSG